VFHTFIKTNAESSPHPGNWSRVEKTRADAMYHECAMDTTQCQFVMWKWAFLRQALHACLQSYDNVSERIIAARDGFRERGDSFWGPIWTLVLKCGKACPSQV